MRGAWPLAVHFKSSSNDSTMKAGLRRPEPGHVHEDYMLRLALVS